MEVSQKTNNRTPYDPAIPLLDTYPKEMKSVSQRDICIPMFIAALLTIAKRRKPVSINERRKNMWYIYSMEYYLAIKKEGNPVICDNMNELGGHYVKWKKSD